jgi:two-component system, sensor histidine kinase and response regulator
MNSQNLFDETAALESLSGDRRLLGELAVMFVEDAPTLLQELEQATERRDLGTACRTIHSVRGLIATFYSTGLVNLASRLEHDAKSGNLDSIRNRGLSELKCSIDELVQALRESGYVER